MRISVITPTCDRPRGMELCERYMTRQTVQADEWIVADGGQVQATLTMGQIHLHQPSPPGAANLAGNMLRALDAITGDVVIVFEDDDAYADNHIETCVAGLAKTPAVGSPKLSYFNVKERMWVKMRNVGSALCQTAFRSELIPEMRKAAEAAYVANDFGIDRRFWQRRAHMATAPMTVYGIKGLPGTPGLGIGHRPHRAPNKRWVSDPQMAKLREWIGADAENYLCF